MHQEKYVGLCSFYIFRCPLSLMECDSYFGTLNIYNSFVPIYFNNTDTFWGESELILYLT